MNSLVQQVYAPRMQTARARFKEQVEQAILDPLMTADELELFLIYFSSIGVSMTEPVESWIRRAGEESEARGFSALGRALKIHAGHEANHHLMMIDDTKMLVTRYNRRTGHALDAEALLAQRRTPGVDAYVTLHERVIASSTPFCQLAIEYEIEGLSVSFGPPLMEHCKRISGAGVVSGLSFLQEHIAIDAGHTKFNEAELEKLLRMDLAFVSPLVEAGTAALDAYGAFLCECLAKARVEARRASGEVEHVASDVKSHHVH